MKKIPPSLLLVALFGAGCVPDAKTIAAPALAQVDTRAPFDPQADDKEIQLRKAAVVRDPQGAIGWSMLSGAHLRRSRAKDSMEDAVAAEQAARKSLKLRTAGNPRAACRLVQALLEQHRFRDAREAVRLARNIAPGDPQACQLEAEIMIEMGDYEEAEKAIREGNRYLDRLSRLTTARASSRFGREKALELLLKAQKEADANHMPRESVAWYHVRVGNLLLAMGRAGEAEAFYLGALDIYPQSYKAMSGLTKVAAGRGNWNAVVKWGHKTEEIVAMPEILALMGDAYAELGDKKMAQEHYGEVVALAAPAHAHVPKAGHSHAPGDKPHSHDEAKPHGHTLDRQYAAFCADHGRALEGLAAARRDIKERPDVVGYDTLAWAAFRAGRQAEARAAIAKAMAHGTQDARTLYHAGMILLESSEKAKAKRLLQRVLALGPAIERRHAREAERALQAE